MPSILSPVFSPFSDDMVAAFGCADWTPAKPEDEILRRLLALNRARAGA